MTSSICLPSIAMPLLIFSQHEGKNVIKGNPIPLRKKCWIPVLIINTLGLYFATIPLILNIFPNLEILWPYSTCLLLTLIACSGHFYCLDYLSSASPRPTLSLSGNWLGKPKKLLKGKICCKLGVDKVSAAVLCGFIYYLFSNRKIAFDLPKDLLSSGGKYPLISRY